ncbi:MAG: phosphatase PAP2 family protein [Rhizobiaceae bacterium]|nr:phosphatase PAP2 family protein [Rhizobiaceae bacterium]
MQIVAAFRILAGKRQRSAFAAAFWNCLRADAPLYLAVALYTVLGLAFLDVTGFSHLATYSSYLGKWLMVFGFVFPAVALLAHYGFLMHRFDRRRQLAARHIFRADRAAYFVAGICLLMALMFFQGTFTSVKNGLSAWQAGFPYERQFADIDAMLHFGVDPWRFLFEFGRHDWLLAFVEWNYGVLWFVFCFGALFYVVTSRQTETIRTRYLMTFMLTWILVGNIMAGIFLCAGPAFYGQVTGDPARFAEQMAFLAQNAEFDGSAAYYQNYLWMLYEKGLPGFGSGISAFPSMHVGLVMLNALFLLERSRLLGLAAMAYVVFVLASSVYLAWHYAVDGYAAIALTIVVYFAMRRWIPDRARLAAAERPGLAESGVMASSAA